MKSSLKEKLIVALVVLAIVGILAAIVLGARARVDGAEWVTATVTDKAIKRTGSGDDSRDIYLIFTDQETFKNTDDLFAGKFNSSDIYGRITVGRSYKFKVVGWRSEWLSEYRNILEVQPE